MPAQTPATFASAAASNGTGDGGSGRGSGASTDWTRPRMNGSQTFRRPSQLNNTTNNAGHQRESSNTVQTPSSAVYLPPHMNSTTGRVAASSDSRYNKDQMLEVFKAQSDAGHKASVATFLTEGWAPGQSSSSSSLLGGAASAGWSRRDENKDLIPGPDVCWDEGGTVKPLAFSAMTDEEKDLFSNSVNSTLKPPQPKDGSQPTGINGRKPSISQGTGSLSSRPGTRRRDTSDSFSGNPLASPGFLRGREENPLASPPPSLLRRRTDIKDGLGGSGADRPRLDTTSDTISPFNSLRRTTTNPLSAGGIHSSGSPWAAEPQSAGGFGRMGSFGVSDQPGTPADKKSGFGSIRGESRFLRDLRGKESSEEVSKLGAKSALPFGMDALSEESLPSNRKQPRPGQRGELGQIGDDPDAQAGSSALVGDEPLDSQSDLPPFRDRMQQREGGQGLGQGFNEPMSPTDTNPYHSPDHERTSVARSRDEDESSYPDVNHPKSNAFDVSDHGSRPSSTAPPRGHPGIGGFGSIGGGWSAGPGPMPSQARSSAFNDPFFGSLSEIGSPGGAGPFGPPSMSGGPGNFGSQRSKLGSLFPQPMQDQMRVNEQRQDFFGSIGSANIPPRDTDSPAARSSRNILDDIFGTQDRAKNVSSAQPPFPGGEGHPQTPSQLQGQQLPFSSAVGTPGMNAQSQMAAGSFFGHASENEQDLLPPAQQRTMVMPDRMRWIYRDPSGKTQGPFSGLEMHDWYKAGFFSPELQVKKLEDGDYEPLAQLIRRIGNSREPFLVPQIGIAHGSIVSLGAAPGLPGGPAIGAASSGTIQPPFAGSFPSFGTTLTAEQQNALERRKQEEQYLMAQQKEFLQQKQQLMMKNPMPFGSPFNMHPGQLHHHSSAHSLQSQPSFGSMGTPASGFPSMPPGPSGPQGGVPGFFDMQRPQQGLGPVGPMHQGPQQQMRDDELAGSFDRMNLNRPGHSPFSGGLGPMMQPGMGPEGQSPVNAMLQDRQRLQQEQFEASQRGQVIPQDPSQGLDRLQEFERLRQQEEDGASAGVIGKPQGHSAQRLDESVSSVAEDEKDEMAGFFEADDDQESAMRPGAVTMPSKDITDVKSTAGLEADVPPPQSVWAPVEKPKAPLEIPPPSLSPLPAPSAQRTNKPLDALATEDRSRSQTPSVETPSSSLAPWATQPSDAPRGPSLKEIQEAEARKAAQQEALVAEQRRQLAEQERIAAAAVPAPAPGLPSSASWANSSSSPVTPGGSAWAKPVAGKPAGSAKKTLAQIQKEEEARKNKAAAAAAAAAATTVAASVSNAALAGKRYAELASKTTSSSTPPAGALPGGAWTTVGAGGKVKSPIGPSTPGSRSVSGTVPTVASVSAAKKPAAPVRAMPAPTASQLATEQVVQWARAALGKGLNAGINVDEMIKSLMQFPLEVDIISDTIYSASTTLDGRRLAEEFVRRRKLADKGIPVADSASGGSGGSVMGGASGFGGAGAGSVGSGTGGWSEVAKKSSSGNSGAAGSSAKEEHGAAFKVVSSKKKGGKR